MWGVRIASVLLATAACQPVLAQDKAPLEPEPVAVYRERPSSYAGLGLFSSTVETPATSQKPGGLHVRMGGMLDEHWGAEVRLARGFWHETDRLGNSKVQHDVDYLAGAYLTSRWAFAVPLVELPMVQRMFIQGHLGIAGARVRSETETCAPACIDRVTRSDRTDLSWGAGLGLEVKLPQVPNQVGLSLEYMHYGDKYDVEISAIEAGFQVFF